MAAARTRRAQGWIDAARTVVSINTGSGVTYLEAERKEPRGLLPVDGELV